jgi:NAD(P)-dependent dehydrogenase (short-subunit alcohol dehydrogenase family)
VASSNDKWLVAGAAGVGLLGLYALVKRRRRYDFDGKVVLINGGSRGLGLILARQLSDLGARIAICARDGEELERARVELVKKGAEVFAQVCDVREREQVRDLVTAVHQSMGPVDVLVNVAGVIKMGPLSTQTQQDFEDLMDVHFWGPFYAIQEVLPSMRQRGAGRIVNITSIGAKLAIPHLSAYCSSKFALAGLSKALRVELEKDGIAVTTVYPGLMRTGSHINARFKGQNEKEFAMFSLADATPLTTINAERAASQIIDACASARAELVITIQAKIAAIVDELAPEFTAKLLAWTDRLLPAEGGIGTASLSGRESTSGVSPSIATTLIDHASVRNNEVNGTS